MKNLIKVVPTMLVVALISFVNAPAAHAAFQTVGATVTVTVPEVLTITSDKAAFTLTFAATASGSESNTNTVVYTVKSNDMGQADGTTAINGNLDFLYTDMDFKAQVGTYTKTVGSNTSLAGVSANYVTVGTANIALANKASTDAGTDGKLLSGSIPITYKAVAKKELTSGSQTHLMFITLTTR